MGLGHGLDQFRCRVVDLPAERGQGLQQPVARGPKLFQFDSVGLALAHQIAQDLFAHRSGLGHDVAALGPALLDDLAAVGPGLLEHPLSLLFGPVGPLRGRGPGRFEHPHRLLAQRLGNVLGLQFGLGSGPQFVGPAPQSVDLGPQPADLGGGLPQDGGHRDPVEAPPHNRQVGGLQPVQVELVAFAHGVQCYRGHDPSPGRTGSADSPP